MIRTVLIFIIVVFLAWLSIDYFSITLPTNESTKQREEPSKEKSSNLLILQKPITTVSLEKKRSMTLLELLNQHLFYDALSLYLEEGSDIQRKQIEAYLATLAKSNATLALEYMQVFLDNVPESSVLKLMITTHIAQGHLAKAIELIMQAKENYVSESEDKRLYTQLRDVAIQHIEALLQRKEYATLISFLEDMAAYDGTDNFYTFRLAQLYMELDKTDKASILLDELKYDEVYAQNVKTLLNTIDNEEEEAYKYAIPLQKYGDHYTVNVFLNGEAFNLILDTGATFIFVDEEKASMLEVLRDDLILETAGNNVNAKLCNAENMKVGNLELSNIEVTVAAFKRNGIDGLLGMNFFKQFTFFINQDENVLYLNPKEKL